MPSPLALAFFAAWLVWMYKGCPGSPRIFLALLIGTTGALAAYDGADLAAREYRRAHDGRVSPGVVVEKFSSIRADGSRRFSTGRRYRRSLLIRTGEGKTFHDDLARWILTGSGTVWVIDYRYGCDRPIGCRGRDFVTEAFWRRHDVGQTVNVRRANGETDGCRLDDNPLGKKAIVDLAIGAGLLVFAAAISGKVKLRRKPRYLTVPAVVTAIEPVKYQDVTRWKIRFAYFDPRGEAQEGADEIVVQSLKPGDEGLAVLPPDQPDLATFRPSTPVC